MSPARFALSDIQRPELFRSLPSGSSRECLRAPQLPDRAPENEVDRALAKTATRRSAAPCRFGTISAILRSGATTPARSAAPGLGLSPGLRSSRHDDLMRLAFTFVALVIGAAPAAASGSEYIEKLRAEMQREPGGFEGWVPGAYLRPEMRPLPASEREHIPIVDVDVACHGGAGCIESEQAAYDSVKLEWDKLTSVDRDVCLVTATSNSAGPALQTFYKRLRVCAAARIGAHEAIERSAPQHFKP